MQAGQMIRRTGSRVAKVGRWVGARFRRDEKGRGWRLTRKVLIGLTVAVPLYYLIGMLFLHEIDADPRYTPETTAIQQGASRTVAMTASLIEREVNEHGWTPNDPILYPSYFLDNMQNYQRGMFAGLSRFTIELADFLGRTRGSSETDADLDEARLITSPGDIWVWNPSKSLMPRQTSESLYREAAGALRRYNARVASGDATFDRRADNLAATLDRLANDIGSSSASLYRVARENRRWVLFDWQSDDTFYETKGRIYAYYMILRELAVDFERIIQEKQLTTSYALMMENLEQVLRIEPLIVLNGNLGSQTLPNHLATQGFLLLRARTQLRELVDILRA